MHAFMWIGGMDIWLSTSAAQKLRNTHRHHLHCHSFPALNCERGLHGLRKVSPVYRVVGRLQQVVHRRHGLLLVDLSSISM